MKKIFFIFFITFLAVTGCNVQINFNNSVSASQVKNEAHLLDFYRQYSTFTDPGEYEYLYESLPDSLPELCSLIRSQFINPYGELNEYRDQFPEERWNEYYKYPTVKSALEGLLSYDSSGLVKDRKVEDRLILTCRDNAILLASILKYRGVPARARYGHATYLIPDFHASHVICEVWSERDNRWMLVDPSTDMVDFSRDKFDFSNDAWLKMQKKEIDPSLYGVPGRYSGLVSIAAKVCGDLASILGIENTIYSYPPLLEYALENDNELNEQHIELLNRISELMNSINANSFLKLHTIYENNPELQFSNSFELSSTNTENNTVIRESSLNNSIIEFVSIPAGTFIMGSPSSEHGRKDDEIQHEVSLNAFEMSTYMITVEQYNYFCDATGRKKPRYGPYGEDKMPVTQVTWNDAVAFAEWMGCRLPTEAEWEYAARAGTTTPFYTGDCLTTDQANYNGNEPYANCENGENRKKPILVGSFPPNEFGLYDMHGNIWEWTNDWYGEYGADENINPKGPETGTRKVDRGGGYYDPAWRCRSAYRGGGTPPGNKGSGISFRIVKSL